MLFRFPDPEFAEAFRAYVNYFEDLAGSIGGLFGLHDSLSAGVHDAVLAQRAVCRISRRSMSTSEAEGIENALRKSWGQLRRMHHEVEDADFFDDESNALLPVMSHYSVYSGVVALTVASGQPMPRDHASALKVIGKEVGRRLFPYPWSVTCSGCPQSGTETFDGLTQPPSSVHVLSRIEWETSEDRLAMFLRTTRAKELERRFGEARRKNPAPGRTRRNVSRAEKDRLAASMAPTTLFDLLWRMRRKASYEDADVFVLGAEGQLDARRFAEAIVIVTDATVAALEAIIAAYIGPDVLAEMAERYVDRCNLAVDSRLAHHAASWRGRDRLAKAG